MLAQAFGVLVEVDPKAGYNRLHSKPAHRVHLDRRYVAVYWSGLDVQAVLDVRRPHIWMGAACGHLQSCLESRVDGSVIFAISVAVWAISIHDAWRQWEWSGLDPQGGGLSTVSYRRLI